MTQLQIRVDASRAVTVNQNLGLAVKTLPAAVIRPIMEDAALEASGYYAGGSSYGVSERGGYVRTGTYGSGVKLVTVSANQYSKVYRVESSAGYSVYVGGGADGAGQAWMHRGRWPTLKAAVSRAVDRIVAACEEAFRNVISSGPGGM